MNDSRTLESRRVMLFAVTEREGLDRVPYIVFILHPIDGCQ